MEGRPPEVGPVEHEHVVEEPLGAGRVLVVDLLPAEDELPLGHGVRRTVGHGRDQEPLGLQLPDDPRHDHAALLQV